MTELQYDPMRETPPATEEPKARRGIWVWAVLCALALALAGWLFSRSSRSAGASDAGRDDGDDGRRRAGGHRALPATAPTRSPTSGPREERRLRSRARCRALRLAGSRPLARRRRGAPAAGGSGHPGRFGGAFAAAVPTVPAHRRALRGQRARRRLVHRSRELSPLRPRRRCLRGSRHPTGRPHR